MMMFNYSNADDIIVLLPRFTPYARNAGGSYPGEFENGRR